jgi:hypothetical protein
MSKVLKFKIGDKVTCTSPSRGVDTERVYNVNRCYIGVGNEEFVSLTEIPDASYLSFRFKLYKEDEDPSTAPGLPTAVAHAALKCAPVYTDVTMDVSTVSPDASANGASKNDSEKIDLSLIPRISNIEHARAFMVGEKKYGRYNYCKGHKASQLVAAAKRHLEAWFENEECDPIDGQHHLGSVMACCSMLLRQQELGTLKDDRFKDESN